MNGKLVPWDDAKIHIGSHVIHYGSGGLRGHPLLHHARGPGGLPPRRAHRAPLQLRQDLPDGRAVHARASSTRRSSRPSPPTAWTPATSGRIVYRGYGQLGVNPFPCPVDVAIMVWDWGKYLGTEALEKGVDVLRQLLDAHRAQHAARHGQDRRQLHELAAHQDGGHQGGLRRGHRPRRRGLPLRGQRREPVPGEEGHAADAAARLLGAARHHARHA